MATIQGIYVALFGRPADPAGLNFFNIATGNGANLTAIGDLAATAEYQSRFTGFLPGDIVNAIFQSLYNRAADAAGLAFFVGELNSGRQNINTIAINILDGAQNIDLVTVNNKIAAANSFTTALNTPSERAAYSGDGPADAGRALLTPITNDATTIPSGAAIDVAILAIENPTPPPPPGLTLVLTNAVGEVIQGGGGDDTISGVRPNTFQVGDQVDGLGGTDTLNLTINAANPGLPAGGGVTNVEIINLIATAAGNTLSPTVDASLFGGATQVWQVTDAANINKLGTGVTAGFRGDYFVNDTVGFNQATGLVAFENVKSFSFISLTGASPTTLLENLTVSGSVQPSGTNPGTLSLFNSTDSAVTQLTLNLTSAAVVNGSVTFTAENIDATGSDNGVTMNGFGFNVETSAFGDGSDIITLFVGTQAQTSNLGAGSDQALIFANGGTTGTLTVTLGSGGDLAQLLFGGNIISPASATFDDNLVVITDFSAADDTFDGLNFTFKAQNLVDAAVVGAANLFAAITAVAAVIDGANTAAQFLFGGNLYYFHSANTVIDNGDTLVELTGVTTTLTLGDNLIA